MAGILVPLPISREAAALTRPLVVRAFSAARGLGLSRLALYAAIGGVTTPHMANAINRVVWEALNRGHLVSPLPAILLLYPAWFAGPAVIRVAAAQPFPASWL
jgi:hypothetical protein